MIDRLRPIHYQTRALVIVLLACASVAESFGFACAVPFAGFAAISAILLPGTTAYAAILCVWLANQVVGFGFLGYPLDASTFAWGAVLGVIAVGSLGAARATQSHLRGTTGDIAGFLSAFCLYEGAIYLTCLASGTDMSHFTVEIVGRIFMVNSITFGILWMCLTALRTTQFGRGFDNLLGHGSA